MKTKLSDIKSNISSIICNTIMIVFSLSCLFPVIWLGYSSLKTSQEFNSNIISLPKSLHFENYIDIILDGEIFVAMWNSARNSAISVFFIIILGFILGYFMARFSFKGKKLLYSYFLIGMLVPVHALMVPMYIIFKRTHLTNEWYTLLIPYIAFGLPIAMFLVEGYIKTLPISLEEAAAIDGSSFSRTLFTIIMPICKPILVTLGIIQVFGCWNEFAFSLILITDQKLRTVPLAVALFQGQYTANYPRMMSAMIITILPVMILYFIFSKQVIEGMVAGAIKG